MCFSRKCVFPLLPLTLIFLTGFAASGVADDDPSKAVSKSETSAKSEPTREQAQTYARPTDPSLYVGAETCKTCHEDMPSWQEQNAVHNVATLDNVKMWTGQP